MLTTKLKKMGFKILEVGRSGQRVETVSPDGERGTVYRFQSQQWAWVGRRVINGRSPDEVIRKLEAA